MLIHPTDGYLNRFADRELPRPWRALVARHLQRCARCRSRVMEIRTLSRDARALEAPPPPPELRQRVLAAVAGAPTSILPLADPAPRGRRWQRLGWAAAATVTLGLALRLVLVPAVLESEASALRFVPGRPVPGDIIDVKYLATPWLAGVERLRLRARFRRAGDPQSGDGIPQVTAAVLTRDGDRTFRGALALPPGVVYVALAVEDEAGERVDGRGHLGFELLTYADGRPSYDALIERANEATRRDLGAALAAITEATERYPERVEAWNTRSALDLAAMGPGARDSLRAAYLPLLRAFDAELRDTVVSAAAADAMYFFASRVGAVDVATRWHARLLTDAPRSTYAAQLRAVDIRASADSADPAPAFAALEALWADAGPDLRVAELAYRFARETGSDAAALRWASRLLHLNPGDRLNVVRYLIDVPAARDSVLEWLRQERRALARPDDTRRPLYVTVAEQRASDERTRREVQGLTGRARFAAGEVQAGLALLDSATARGWSLPLFEHLADARLQVRDVRGAVQMLARLAVDPAYGGDDPTARALALVPRAEWERATLEAERLMVEETPRETDPTSLPRPLRVADPDGTARDLRPLLEGRITAVAVFWPGCLACYGDLLRLQESVGRLPQPVGAILVGTTQISAEQLAALRAVGVTLPVAIDAHGEFAAAVGSWGTPEYYLVDAHGVVRFANTTLEDIPRQVLALQRSGERIAGPAAATVVTGPAAGRR